LTAEQELDILSNALKTGAMWLLIILAAILLYNIITKQPGKIAEIPFNEVVKYGDQGMIKTLKVGPDKLEGEFFEEQAIGTTKALGFVSEYFFYDDFVPRVLTWDTIESIKFSNDSASQMVMTILVYGVPLILILVIWVFFIRQMQAGGNRAMMFGKSRAKLLNATQKKITFKDVAGCDEAKDELQEIIDFLKEPQKFQRLGGKIPKGVLMMGPPGTGKTLLARASAGEANVPFFSISGSDFVEMFVGVGASRVRDLFEQGKKNAPCIIFIDEIDAVGRHRGAGMGGGHDEREQTLNQLLVEMDGFESNDGVILVAATNRPDVLDPAILRPGRFDRRVVVDLPDVKGRLEILRVHTRKVPLAQDVELQSVARGTPGFAGADLANLVNEAALYAARRGKKVVERLDFEDSKDKVLMGSQRRSLILSEEEKRTTAIHESGHAVVASLIGESDPVHKVTIIPRGRALGVTIQLPLDDRHSYSATFLRNRISITMGGRVAEEIWLNQQTSGASQDIEHATKIARSMVCDMGMSRELGPVLLRDPSSMPFLGRDFNRSQNISEVTAQKIDQEVRRLIEEGESRARQILQDNRSVVETMTEKLLELETLEEWQIQQIVRGEPVTGEQPQTNKPGASSQDKGTSKGLGLLPDPNASAY
jgi:cell division protease FtsH